MKKPTPAQARILKALNQPYETPRGTNYRQPCLYIYNRYVRKGNLGDLGSISKVTAIKLIEYGYIEPDVPESQRYIISESGKDILLMLNESDFITPESSKPKPPLWKTHELLKALTEKYDRLNGNLNNGYPPKWIYFPELQSDPYGGSRIDLFVMCCWRSTKFLRISYEIKISRGDFLNEIKHPEKSKFARLISNQYIYVTPPGLIKVDEIKESDGLMELNEKGKFVTIQKPTYSESIEPYWAFIAGMGRKLFKGNNND